MPAEANSLAGPQRIGPIRWQRLPYRTGEAAEPTVRYWLKAVFDLPADATVFRRDVHGRPRMAAPDWDASWSHSGDGLLVAAGQGVWLGVDLERQRARPRALELARRFFSPAEADWLAALPAERQQPMFVRLWCAKEALLKAHGRGIAFGLHRLQFAFDADDRLRLLHCDPALGQPGQWQLHEAALHPGERAVLAWRPTATPPTHE